MRENVVPFVPLALMRTMQSVMFCAHDYEGEHTLSFCKREKRWLLEGRSYSELTKRYHRGVKMKCLNLVSGLSQLERFSKISAHDFTITDNPYNRNGDYTKRD